jgi:hypothetical protein
VEIVSLVNCDPWVKIDRDATMNGIEGWVGFLRIWCVGLIGCGWCDLDSQNLRDE